MDVQKLLQSGLVWRAEENTSSLIEGANSNDSLFAPFEKGTVHEWFHSYEDHFNHPPFSIAGSILGALQEVQEQAKKKFIIHIGKEVWPTAYFLRDCFPSSGSLSRDLLFINVRSLKARLWAIETALASPQVRAVISFCSGLTFPMTQRFLLAAKRGDTLGFIFRDQKELALKSAAHTRWHLSPVCSSSESPRWSLKLMHTKSSHPSKNNWVLELCNEKKVSLNIFSELVNQSDPERVAYQRTA